MKSLIYALLFISLDANAKVDLPIFGEYRLHQQLEGGCFRLSKNDRFFIRYSENAREYLIGREGKRCAPFSGECEYYSSHFLSSRELGVHESPTQTGLAFVTTFAPFNEGRGLHAAEVVTAPGSSFRSVIVDATFEVDGNSLFANFRNTRLINNEGAGKCILKRIPSNQVELH